MNKLYVGTINFTGVFVEPSEESCLNTLKKWNSDFNYEVKKILDEEDLPVGWSKTSFPYEVETHGKTIGDYLKEINYNEDVQMLIRAVEKEIEYDKDYDAHVKSTVFLKTVEEPLKYLKVMQYAPADEDSRQKYDFAVKVLQLALSLKCLEK